MDQSQQTSAPAQGEEQLPLPQNEFVIQDLDTLRALSDPLRLRILELLAQPQTAKALATKLALGKTKLYYHLNLLEKHGIIRVVRTRVVSGIIEKSYQVTALSYRPARELLLHSEEGRVEGSAIVDSILEATRTDLVQSLKSGGVAIGATAHEQQLLLGRVVVSLTAEQAQSFYARLQALLDEVAQYETPTAAGRLYALTVTFFPKDETPSA